MHIYSHKDVLLRINGEVYVYVHSIIISMYIRTYVYRDQGHMNQGKYLLFMYCKYCIYISSIHCNS